MRHRGRSRLRLRGASTQSSLFYIIIGALVLAATVYAYQQGSRAFRGYEAKCDIPLIAEGVRGAYYFNGGIEDATYADISALGVVPKRLQSADKISFSGGMVGDVIFPEIGMGTFVLSLTWPDNGRSSTSLCTELSVGAEGAHYDEETGAFVPVRVSPGPMGNEYWVVEADCSAASPTLVAVYEYGDFSVNR